MTMKASRTGFGMVHASTESWIPLSCFGVVKTGNLTQITCDDIFNAFKTRETEKTKFSPTFT